MNANVRTPVYVEIWNGVVKHRFRILLALFAVAAFTLVGSALLPKTYEGVLLIRIGQITIANREPVPIEQPKVVLDRLKNPAFLRRVSGRAFKDPGKKQLFRTRGLPAGTMEITTRARSTQDASAALQAAFIELRSAHEKIATPYITALKESLVDVTSQIAAIQAQEKQALSRIAAAASLTDQRAILAAMASEAVRTEISDLRDKEMSLRRALLPPFTYMTDMVEPIYADSNPIFPDPVLNTVVAVLVVLGISIFLIALQTLQARDGD